LVWFDFIDFLNAPKWESPVLTGSLRYLNIR